MTHMDMHFNTDPNIQLSKIYIKENQRTHFSKSNKYTNSILT